MKVRNKKEVSGITLFVLFLFYFIYRLGRKSKTEVSLDKATSQIEFPNLEKNDLTSEDLFVRAMLTQICYQRSTIISNNFETTYKYLGSRKNKFFSGTEEEASNHLERLFDMINLNKKNKYILRKKIKFLETNNTNYRVFCTEIKMANNKEYLIISIRGTANIRNVITDIEGFIFMDGPKDIAGSRIIKSEFSSYRSWLRDTIMKEVNKYKMDKPIYVLGHSLGGSWAAYAAYDILRSGKTDVSMYTYNSPRASNQIFANFLNKNLNENIRHTNSIEFISTLPSKNWLGNPRHSGVEYRTNIRFKETSEGSPCIIIDSIEKLTTNDITKNFSINLLFEYGISKLIMSHEFSPFGADKITKFPTIRDIPFLQKKLFNN